MAVFYRYKSAKDFFSLPIDGPSISVADLKLKIFNSSRYGKIFNSIGYGKGRDFDLIVTNAQTNEDYVDDTVLIQNGTSVVIRRLPWPPGRPITVDESRNPKKGDKETLRPCVMPTTESTFKLPNDDEWGEVAEEMFAIGKEVCEKSINQVINQLDYAEEDRRIKALVNTPALDWQSKPAQSYTIGGIARRVVGEGTPYNFDWNALGFKKPPQGYICHRCQVPGHFIQECPTKGDPDFDHKKLKQATGIPKFMLLASQDGSYSLPNGVTAVLQPNEAAFEKEIEGILTPCSPIDLPPELHCSICKKIMKDAVLCSKCCFISYCDKCLRDHIISKKMCICGAKNVLADDIIPNPTVRDTINRILLPKSTSSISGNSGSTVITDTGSGHHLQQKHPSPAQSIVSAEAGANKQLKADTALNAVENTIENEMKLKAMSGSINTTPSVLEETSPSSQWIKGKFMHGEKVMVKRNKMQSAASNVAENSKLAFQDLSAASECYAGMHPMQATYNPYWSAGAMPFGFGGYSTPYYADMSYAQYPYEQCYPLATWRENTHQYQERFSRDVAAVGRDAAVSKPPKGLTKSKRRDDEADKSHKKRRKHK